MATYDPYLVESIEAQSNTLLDQNSTTETLDSSTLNSNVSKMKDDMADSKNKYKAIDKKKPIVSFNENKDENSIANLCGLSINIPAPNWSWKWKWNINPSWNFKLPTWKMKLSFCMDNAASTVQTNKQTLDRTDYKNAMTDAGLSQSDIDEAVRKSKEQSLKDEITNEQKMVDKEYSNKQSNSFVEIYKVMADATIAASAVFSPLAAQTTLVQGQLLAMGNDLIKCRFRNLLNIPLSPCQKYFLRKIQTVLYNKAIQNAMVQSGVNVAVIATSNALSSGQIPLTPSLLSSYGVPTDMARAAVFPELYPDLAPALSNPTQLVAMSTARGLSTDATAMLLARNGINYADTSTISAIYGTVGKDVTNQYGSLDTEKMGVNTSLQDMSAVANYLTAPKDGLDHSYPDMINDPEDYKIMMGIENMSNRIDNVNIVVEDIAG